MHCDAGWALRREGSMKCAAARSGGLFAKRPGEKPADPGGGKMREGDSPCPQPNSMGGHVGPPSRHTEYGKSYARPPPRPFRRRAGFDRPGYGNKTEPLWQAGEKKTAPPGSEPKRKAALVLPSLCFQSKSGIFSIRAEIIIARNPLLVNRKMKKFSIYKEANHAHTAQPAGKQIQQWNGTVQGSQSNRARRAGGTGRKSASAGAWPATKARPPPPRAGWRTRAAVRAPEPRHGEKDGKGCPALGITVAGRALRRRRGDHRHRRGAG